MKDYFFFFLFFHVWFFYILFQIQISWSNYELMIRINRWCLKRLNILKGVHISNLKNFWCKFETISTNQIFQRIKHAHIYIFYSSINIPTVAVYLCIWLYLFCCYCIKCICLYLILITYLYQCIKVHRFLDIHVVSIYFVFCNLL